MPFTISLQPGGQQFPIESDQTILEAALAAGFVVPYGCRDGACGACKARVDEGQIDQGAVSATALTSSERAEGMALLCKAHALGDLAITVRNLTRAGDLPVKKLPCRVQSIERVASDVIVLKLKLPASEPFRFRAGQYVDFVLDGGRRRSFSIANVPAGADHLELHVRRIDGGSFTGHVFEGMKEKDILRFEGPLGSFGLDAGDRPAVLIAGGTGFAPIKSMVEDLIASGRQRTLALYWGSRTREGLYMDQLARSWEQALPGFRYVPVLSEPLPTDGWTGRTGLVHHAVMADLPDLSGFEAYACGSPAMIDAARADLVSRCGLPADAFFADAFTFASA
ncbi:MAG: CDP-6-deoxy-delta-3,4-glucoseen reductase [Zoogloeaceae bacterium]|nr:CDP-6-deoxy-delta-3,4-glucoseen reductase [Zoogloeaceae bacterium]